MKTLSLSEVKMKLSALVDEVHRTDQEIVITRNGVPVAVLVSPDELESWRETVSIRLDPESVSEIREGLAALEESRSLHPRGALRGLTDGGLRYRLS